MKKEITLGQLLSVSVTIVIALITGWITLSNKVATQERDLKNLEIRFVDMQISIERKFDRLENKIDHTNGILNEVKVLLERKQDRK